MFSSFDIIWYKPHRGSLPEPPLLLFTHLWHTRVERPRAGCLCRVGNVSVLRLFFFFSFVKGHWCLREKFRWGHVQCFSQGHLSRTDSSEASVLNEKICGGSRFMTRFISSTTSRIHSYNSEPGCCLRCRFFLWVNTHSKHLTYNKVLCLSL